MTDLTMLADGLPEQRGPLGLLSGDEFGPQVAEFDRALLAASGPRIGLVICADHRAALNTTRMARAHFGTLGAEVLDADVVHGDDHPDVDLIYVGGGSPAELLACLRDNPRWAAVADAWRGGTGLAGASAGAMALCEHTLEPRPGDRVPTVWTRGLGPVATVALAVHAGSRPPTWLQNIKGGSPVRVLALDDYTGVIIHADGRVQREGPGDVWFA